MTRWIVRCDHDEGAASYYGPFDDVELAAAFADFVTKEIDPATVCSLRTPIYELLGMWKYQQTAARNENTGAGPR